MIKFANAFTKITAWPVQLLCFRTKIYYETKEIQSRKINGPAILISNHTSVFDYAVYMFVFFSRTLRVQMAEVLMKEKILGWFLRQLGGILVDRTSHSLDCIYKSEDILNQGGVVGIFPEGRLPRKGEKTPLKFTTGAAYLALSTNVPVIPVYTNGSYFNKKRARVIIGTPIIPSDYIDGNFEKENIDKLTNIFRNKIIDLEQQLIERAN